MTGNNEIAHTNNSWDLRPENVVIGGMGSGKSRLSSNDTMTVRVIDRSGWGKSGDYPAIKTIIITAICPICGARRGEPQPHRFHEDGQWLVCDKWTNPCGHVDMYETVLAEAKSRHETGEDR